jgi:CBS-domain-containing membrane protein
MQENKVRRLPVVDREGRLAGMVSLADVAVRADGRADTRLRDELYEALRSISEPPPSDTAADDGMRQPGGRVF